MLLTLGGSATSGAMSGSRRLARSTRRSVSASPTSTAAHRRATPSAPPGIRLLGMNCALNIAVSDSA